LTVQLVGLTVIVANYAHPAKTFLIAGPVLAVSGWLLGFAKKKWPLWRHVFFGATIFLLAVKYFLLS